MRAKYPFSKQLTALVVVIIVVCIGTVTHAAEFRADLRVIEERATESGKFYVKSNLVRMEKSGESDQGVLIADVQKNITRVLDPKGKRYVEIPKNICGFIPPREITSNAIKKFVGSEKIGVYKCKKYKYFLPKKKEASVTQWVATAINFPVKACYHDENKCWELANIQQGPVDDAMFQVPQNYQKVTVKSIDKGGSKKGAGQSSSAPKDETSMLIDMAKLDYTKGDKANAALQLKHALNAVWREIPFMVANVRLVPKGGSFEHRANNVYQSGERIYVACHVLGYKVKNGKAQMTADFYFLDAKDKVLFNQKEFGRFKLEAAVPNPETQLDFNFRMSGVSAGNYALKVVLHDKNSGDSIEFLENIVFQ
jgi:hypothetical protein